MKTNPGAGRVGAHEILKKRGLGDDPAYNDAMCRRAHKAMHGGAEPPSHEMSAPLPASKAPEPAKPAATAWAPTPEPPKPARAPQGEAPKAAAPAAPKEGR